jgi:hypothetical protein
MANLTYDVRRTDQRANVFETPYWITSGVIGFAAGTYGLFSFGVADQVIWVHAAVVQITTVYDALTLDVGIGSIPLDTSTAGAVLTAGDADEYIKNTNVTGTTAGYYGSLTAQKSDWLVNIITGSFVAPNLIVGLAADVPLVYATVAGATSGAARFHMLISRMPGK